MSNVGAFAYCIEATESLSRVSTYFLQQKANLRDASDLTSWMTRFKELDLRLVHWKMLLPQKWKADMARQSRRMDPNLTVAHVTHNASMILLHQIIAFPPMELPIRNRLPSFLSAETCQSAAVEIATITENYLRFAPPTLPTSNQFAFCVYIAARVLIISWKYHVPDSESQESIAPAFWSLKLSLDEMAKRWVGSGKEAVLQHCLAAKYSRKLMQLFSVCQNSGFLAIEVTGYTAEIDHSLDSEALGDDDRASEQNRQAQNESQTLQEQIGTYINKNVEHTGGYDFREATNADQALQAMPVVGARTSMGPCVSDQANHAPDVRRRAALGEELGSISQMLLDQQFMGMDRVISYDDGMFGTDYDGVGW
jgi:hypothetical protein